MRETELHGGIWTACPGCLPEVYTVLRENAALSSEGTQRLLIICVPLLVYFLSN